MKGKPTIFFGFFSLMVILVLFLCGCSESNSVKEIRLKDNSIIEISQGIFSYEGKKLVLIYEDEQEEEIDLDENMIPEEERLKFFKIGEQDVKIVYRRLSTSMKIIVDRKDFEDIYSLVGYTCIYDGLAHKVELNNELPDGATIDYLYGNSFINAGEYEVKAVISKDGYNPKTLSTTLIIEKADYDESKIIFNDSDVVYDGKAKTIEATNIPEGVIVKYDIYYLDNNIGLKEAKEAGNYRVVARFESTGSNYNRIGDKEAILTIKKAKYDMSNVILNDYTKTYDGVDYVPSLDSASRLPKGVSVEFKCFDSSGNPVQSNANAGKYKIVASFLGDDRNYEHIPKYKLANLDVLSKEAKEQIRSIDVLRQEAKNSNLKYIAILRYIKEKYGLKVDANNILSVKQMLGIVKCVEFKNGQKIILKLTSLDHALAILNSLFDFNMIEGNIDEYKELLYKIYDDIKCNVKKHEMPTNQDIIDYVKVTKKYTVNNAMISFVRKDLGIEKRKDYCRTVEKDNLRRKPNAEQYDAIIDAFKHFHYLE